MRSISATVVLSAFLLFLVQPLIGKVVLPWFGGAPAVWTTCLLFFQLVLLGGYAWSHGVVTRLTASGQRRAHLGLLALASLAVIGTAVWWGTPLVPPSTFRPADPGAPVLALLGLLLLTVGLPYFTLSSTGPLLQAWVARTLPAATALRLYAWSNLGSIAGLLAFPVVFEPRWPLKTLAWAWAIGFLCFAALCASVAWAAPAVEREAAAVERLPASTRARWVLLAAVPSALLLSLTNHLTQDVAPVPFLWVLPLVLYLASFVLTFDSARWYRRGWALPALFALAVVVAALLLYPNEPSVVLALGGHLGFLFVACVACHGELVKLRPAEGHLTSFYLSVSIGGGAGGAFVALVAPVLFKDFWELQLTLALAVVVVAVEVARTASKRVTQALLAATTLVVVLLGWSVASRGRTVIERRRDFFGVVRVQSDPRGLVLVHGRVAHGAQFADPARARVPTAYYAPPSGVGRLLSAPSGPRHIGGIGLGLGTIAGYARPGDTLRFYEISPSVVAYATGAGGYFTFLSGAPTPPEVVLGDARTSLEREPPNAFDVLVVDAFSGDSVPTHLLTREALQLYLRHLRGPGSVIAVHVSNWYLDLHPVVAALAKDLGLTVVRLESESTEGWAIPSSWMLLARDPEALRALPSNEVVPSGGPVWTDEFTSLWGLVQW